MLLEEEKLVTLAIGGDYEAFEQLIERYALPLARFTSHLMSNTEDARDVVQQILFQVYKSLPTLQNPAYFRAWLFKIAHHKCLENLRRSTNRSELAFAKLTQQANEDAEDVSLEQSVPDPGPLPLELLERQETRQLLQDAINQLPPRQRQVVILRYITELTFADIAQVLDTNENTIKTLFQRAKASLRVYLGQRL